jgi:beta-N-acetylhexosaminidase
MINTDLYLEKLSLKEKIGQMFLVGFPGSSLSQETADFIEESNVGFIILFNKNIESLKETINLTNQIHNLSKIQPFIFTDQEGGTVVQFGELTSTLISPLGISQTGEPGLAEEAGSIIAGEMDVLGLDGVFSPVLDTNTEENNPIIGIRAFSDNPHTVYEFAIPYFQGIKKHNIIACCKHFPGHGDTVTDSHRQLPVVNNSLENLQSCHLLPFARLISTGVDAILTSHILFKKIGNKIATFDPFFLTKLLRQQFGFKGIVFTDCLEMNAIKSNFTPREIVLNSINAGVDVLAASQSIDFQEKLLDNFISLVKEEKISEERIDQSVRRILYLKEKYHPFTHRKIRAFDRIEEIRSKTHRRKEAEIAQKSILVKQDLRKLLPLDRNKQTLLIEWEKVMATMTPNDASPRFMLKKTLEQLFPSSTDLLKVRMLKLDGSLPADLTDSIIDSKQVICTTFSRTPQAKALQLKALEKILKIRKDLIVAALGNPYELDELKEASTLIASFGFRQCQLDALCRILTGQ